MPKLSIGLPVYNGAKYLSRAIDSALAQDVPDLELIISDNASTDETEAICRARAASDARVKYVRQEANRGSLANFEQVLRTAGGDFFFWAAHDDQWHPDFAKNAISALEERPEAAGAMGTVRYTDASGKEIRARDTPPYHLADRDRRVRISSYFANRVTDTLIYGVFRREALLDAPFVLSTCPEKMIIAHAVLWGPIIDVAAMEYTSLQIPKDHALVAQTIGIAKYDFENEVRVLEAMTSLLRENLGLVDLVLVYPTFFVRNNWHKFLAKRLLHRIA